MDNAATDMSIQTPVLVAPGSLVLSPQQVRDLAECFSHTPVMKLLDMVPWNMYVITKKRSSTNINDNLDIPWDEKALSERTKVGVDTLKRYPEVKWRWKDITKNTKAKVIEQHPDLNWDVVEVKKKKSDISKIINEKVDKKDETVLLRLKLFVKKFGFKCDFNRLAKSYGFERVFHEFGMNEKQKFDPFKFSNAFAKERKYCSHVVNDDSDDSDSDEEYSGTFVDKAVFLVRNYPYLNWDMEELTQKANSSLIVNYRYLRWDLNAVANKRHTVQLYLAFPEIPWDMAALTKCATTGDVLVYPNIPWDQDAIMKKPFHIGLYNLFPNFPWDKKAITKAVDWQYIRCQPNLGLWSKKWLSKNAIPESVFLADRYASIWDYEKITLKTDTDYGKLCDAFIREARKHFHPDLVRVVFQFL